MTGLPGLGMVILFGVCTAACQTEKAACLTAESETPPFRHEITTSAKPWTDKSFDNAPNKFTFAVFGDLTGGERKRIFETAVAELNLLRPELIMSVGDYIKGASRDPKVLNREWNDFDRRANRSLAPIFYVGGNHDLGGALLRDVWKQRRGPWYYHFVYRNVLFLVLDSEDISPERMREIRAAKEEAFARANTSGSGAFDEPAHAKIPEWRYGAVGEAQAEYFIDAIADNPDVRWTFVFVHKPVWRTENEPHFSKIEAALSARPYTVFHGHTHLLDRELRRGRDYINISTTGASQFPRRGRSTDHVTLVTVGETDVSIAHLLLGGILDKTGCIPLGGDTLQFEKPLGGGGVGTMPWSPADFPNGYDDMK